MTTAGSETGLDPQVAVRARGLLRHFNEAGALSSADVHVAQRLGLLGGESDESVLLAAALAVRAVRAGSVCVALDEAAQHATVVADGDAASGGSAHGLDSLPWPAVAQWQAACQASPIVAVGPDGDPAKPLRLVNGLVYLDRYWRQEQVVRTELDGRLTRPGPDVPAPALATAIAEAFDDAATPEQRLAAAVAAVSRVTVLTGGPGTGKTTTVARVLAVLTALPESPVRIALAAPTGKAAARLQEAVRGEVAGMGEQVRERLGAVTASTVHRLLGWRPGSRTRFRHDRSNRLPHDVVVVDETSMVSLTLMSRLLEALRPGARLVLVGDPDQLASVEAGAVLGDLVARPVTATLVRDAVRDRVPDLLPADAEDRTALGNGVVRLARVHRYAGAIADLAAAVRAGDADAVVAVLTAGTTDVVFSDLAEDGTRGVEQLRQDVVEAAGRLVRAARQGDAAAALEALEQHRLLLAHRRGPFGVQTWSVRVEDWVRAQGVGADRPGEWYPGRPLLVTANDRDTGLYNGDTGVVVQEADGLVAVFGTPQSPVRVAPHRLDGVQTVHAMTVHRGQGSQFQRVSLLLPGADSPLLTRELLYTAVTRARQLIRVLGTEEAVRTAVDRPVRRASGLRIPLP